MATLKEYHISPVPQPTWTNLPPVILSLPTDHQQAFLTTVSTTLEHMTRATNAALDRMLELVGARLTAAEKRLATVESELALTVGMVVELQRENDILKSIVGGGSRGPHAALPEKFEGGDQTRADEFSTAVVNASKFETFPSDELKILWCQGFLTGEAHKWSSNITHDASTDPAQLNFSLWIAAFRSTYCTRDREGDALRALNSLSMGDRSISAYVTEFKALRLDLPAAERNGLFVMDRFKTGLSLPAAERLAQMQPRYTTVDQALEYLLDREVEFAELEKRRALVSSLTPSLPKTSDFVSAKPQ